MILTLVCGFQSKRAPKLAQNEVFRFYGKSMYDTFQGVFCMKFQHDDLKLTKIYFLERILHWDYWEERGPK